MCARSRRDPLKYFIFGIGVLVTFVMPGATFADSRVLATTQASANTQSGAFTFGVVPQQSASRLAQMWGPLLQRLSEDLGAPVRFETANDIPTFEACLSAGAYDFAYMNPVHYTIFSEVSGYRALARQIDKKLHGLIVVHKDSDITALSDLAGVEVAFPSPGAFGASVVPRAEIKAQGIEITPRYVKSHDSVYRAVAAGLLPAGGGVLRTFNAVDPAIRDQLRVIYRTDGYTPHALASLANVPEAVLSTLQETLADITQNHPDLAKSVGMNGFETASDQDWDDVRALNLGTRETGIQTESATKCPSG